MNQNLNTGSSPNSLGGPSASVSSYKKWGRPFHNVTVRHYECEALKVISGPVKSAYSYLGHPSLGLLARGSFSLRRQELSPRGVKYSLLKTFNSTIELNLYLCSVALMVGIVCPRLWFSLSIEIEMLNLLSHTDQKIAIHSSTCSNWQSQIPGLDFARTRCFRCLSFKI